MAPNVDWVSHGIDPTAPNAARVYNYWLDGAHNFAVDREMANKVQQVVPRARDGTRVSSWSNRGWWAAPTGGRRGPGDFSASPEMNSISYGGVGRKL